jgi:hypothetical protein
MDSARFQTLKLTNLVCTHGLEFAKIGERNAGTCRSRRFGTLRGAEVAVDPDPCCSDDLVRCLCCDAERPELTQGATIDLCR